MKQDEISYLDSKMLTPQEEKRLFKMKQWCFIAFISQIYPLFHSLAHSLTHLLTHSLAHSPAPQSIRLELCICEIFIRRSLRAP